MEYFAKSKIEKLKRRLVRLREQQDKMEKEYQSNELKYTFWAGFDLGYCKGKMSEIENILDEIEKR